MVAALAGGCRRCDGDGDLRRTKTGHRRELEPEMGDREGGAQGMQKLTRNVGVGSDRAEEVEQ
jgi:hypothetical protein